MHSSVVLIINKAVIIMNYRLIQMQIHGDHRGKLVSLESLRNCPFEIKRCYYIFDTLPEQVRGLHAHTDMEQILIALDGACQIVLDDGLGVKEKFWLNTPEIGLYIGKNIWREMQHFSYGCKLLVLASDYYDEREYIRDYQEFLRVVREQKLGG